MSSMFELDERVRRLRETLVHLRNTTLSDAAEICSASNLHSDPRVREDWLSFVSELRDFLSAVEALAPRPKRTQSAFRKPPNGGAIADAFRVGATLH